MFVFGSNLAGRHGKGAALWARQHRGAIYGQASGRQGNSYAIPTKDEQLLTLPLDRIKPFVETFLDHAATCKETVFQLTPIGCGLAGYRPQQIAPMFRGVTKNVRIPDEFTTFVKSRILVTGGRAYANKPRVWQILDAAVIRLDLGFLIQGGATGADALAKEWALERNILCAQYDADWSMGAKAGPMRNARMITEGKPDYVIAFPGGNGTADCVRQAIAAGVKVFRVDE